MQSRLTRQVPVKPMSSKTRVERRFYRNGQLREEIHFLGRQLHGFRRVWHHNGRLALEESYEHGLLHGQCRQWNDRGKLLGSFRMKHGTGIQREWFENGQPRLETSTVDGMFTGRTRFWMRDGTLTVERFAVERHEVSPRRYRAIAKQHPEYPIYRATPLRASKLEADEIERREFRLHVAWLLSRRNCCEAREWLEAGAQERSLGLLNFTQARHLVECLYNAGAKQVVAVGIYEGKSGKRFSDGLVIKMPPEKRSRHLIRQLLTKLPKKLRAGAVPGPDSDEDFLFATFE